MTGSAPRHLPEALGRRYLMGFDTAGLTEHTCDVLVVGSGIAGLTAALLAAQEGSDVCLVTKAELTETNTWYAQGGIAGAVGESDSVELHLADTLVAGAGLCDEAVVRAVVEEAPDALAALQARGVRFDTADGGGAHLALEGGHSLPRVLHSGDATGAEIQDTLSGVVAREPFVRIAERRFLVDLLTDEAGERCIGALVLDETSGALEVYRAGAIVLATGGSGQLFAATTNPVVATGDGVAAAWRAGAEVSDLEFVQFHPTAFDAASGPRFLITEALRGEGAYLLDDDGSRFMLGAHPLAELAPRDIVTRRIEQVMEASGTPNVWLDARHLGAELLERRFPTVWATCLESGYDLARDLVPVAPAAHYMIGGVRVDLDGRTSLPGLYASGEVAASGLHGANRLASNSLLEGLVFSRRIVRTLASEAAEVVRDRVVGGVAVAQDDGPAGPGPSVMDATIDRGELQRLMSAQVGVTRSEAGLTLACDRLAELSVIVTEPEPTAGRLEMRNLVTLGTLLAHAARYRTESRGTHYRTDFPERDDAGWRVHTVWRRGTSPRSVPAG